MSAHPNDVCPCGSEAATATGNPLVDHTPTCSVYLAEHYRRALTNLAAWRDEASMESAREYARISLRDVERESNG